MISMVHEMSMRATGQHKVGNQRAAISTKGKHQMS